MGNSQVQLTPASYREWHQRFYNQLTDCYLPPLTGQYHSVPLIVYKYWTTNESVVGRKWTLWTFGHRIPFAAAQGIIRQICWCHACFEFNSSWYLWSHVFFAHTQSHYHIHTCGFSVQKQNRKLPLKPKHH